MFRRQIQASSHGNGASSLTRAAMIEWAAITSEDVAAAGYNFNLLLRWLGFTCPHSCTARRSIASRNPLKSSSTVLLEVGGSRPSTLLVSVLRRGRLGTIHKSGEFPLPE